MPVPVYAQYATSDCEKPDSSWPDWMPLTLATEPFDATAVATRLAVSTHAIWSWVAESAPCICGSDALATVTVIA